MTNLKSSTTKVGKIVTQIITFRGGTKKTIQGILTETIQEGGLVKFRTTDGRLVMINQSNVLCVEVFDDGVENMARREERRLIATKLNTILTDPDDYLRGGMEDLVKKLDEEKEED